MIKAPPVPISFLSCWKLMKKRQLVKTVVAGACISPLS